MGYEINVSQNGVHFFATHERSLKTKGEFERAVKVFKEKFPKSEGYEVSASYWQKTGETIAI